MRTSPTVPVVLKPVDGYSHFFDKPCTAYQSIAPRSQAPRTVGIDPDAQVLIREKCPSSHVLGSTRWPYNNPGFNENVPYLLEPYRPDFKRRFRPTSIWAWRWKPGLTYNIERVLGEPKYRCRDCWWVQSRSSVVTECKRHRVRLERTRTPYPNAGKVFHVLSTVKLYGLPAETPILIQQNGVWRPAVVSTYIPWREIIRTETQRLRTRANQERRQLNAYDRILDGLELSGE